MGREKHFHGRLPYHHFPQGPLRLHRIGKLDTCLTQYAKNLCMQKGAIFSCFYLFLFLWASLNISS